MTAGGITFGAAKAELATVAHNGILPTESRLIARVNEATKMLLDEIIPVNGMMTADVTATGTTLLLPKEMENAIEAHPVSGGGDVAQGWYEIVNPFTYVDPSLAHDNPLVDLFLQPDPGDATILRRKYDYPGLTPNATVRVTGAKRYLPITGDGDYLIIQNVRALKLAVLSIEREENNAVTDADQCRQMALGLLQAEVKKHQLDPSNSLARKYAYQSDLTTYNEGTLGRTRARLALELPGFLGRGKSEITYLVNRAVQMLVDNRNQLAIAGRLQINAGTTELVYAPATAATDALVWGDYNPIRLLVQSFTVENFDTDKVSDPLIRKMDVATLSQELQKRAFDLQQAQLIEQTEKLRHTTYTTALTAYIAASTFAKLGYVRSKLGLELPEGLKLSFEEMRRLVNEAAREAVGQYNFLGRTERYSNTTGPNVIVFTYAQSDSDDLPYSDFEVLRLLVLAILDPANAVATRQQAFALIERNLAADVEATRLTTWKGLETSNPDPKFGGVRARMGLEIAGGYALSDDQVAQLVRQAWEQAVLQFNSVVRHEDVQLTAKTVPSTITDATVVDFPFETIKLLVSALTVQDNAARASELKGQALALVERDAVQQVETARRDSYQTLSATARDTYGGVKGRMALELPGGYGIPDARMGSLVTQAVAMAVDHHNFIGRREDYDAALTFSAPSTNSDVLAYSNTDVIKSLVSYQLAEKEGSSTPQAEIHRKTAYDIIERDLMRDIESARKAEFVTLAAMQQDTLGGLTGRIGLELPDGYTKPKAYWRRLINQAYETAIDHYNFVARRESYQEASLTYAALTSDATAFNPEIPAEVIKLLVLALVDSQNPQGADRQTQALSIVERNVVKDVESTRRDARLDVLTAYPYPNFGGTWASFALEIAGGYTRSDSQMQSVVTQAWAEAIRHYNFVGRREDYEVTPQTLPTPVNPSSQIPFPIEVIKLLATALFVQDETAKPSELKTQAFSLIERDLKEQVESDRRELWQTNVSLSAGTFGQVKARIALDLQAYDTADAMLGRLVNRGLEALVNRENHLRIAQRYDVHNDRGHDFDQPDGLPVFGGNYRIVDGIFQLWNADTQTYDVPRAVGSDPTTPILSLTPA